MTFSGENRIVIINMQEALRPLHLRPSLANSGSENFACLHVAAAVASVQERLKDRLQIASDSLVAQLQACFATYATFLDVDSLDNSICLIKDFI